MNDPHTIHENQFEIKLSVSYRDIVRYGVFLGCIIIALVVGYLLGKNAGTETENTNTVWRPAVSHSGSTLGTKGVPGSVTPPSAASKPAPAGHTDEFTSQHFFAPITASSLANTENSPENKIATNGRFFASKSGKVYYAVGCKSGNRVKSENRIYFDSSSEAGFEGLKKAARC
jgi:hypothetical protein